MDVLNALIQDGLHMLGLFASQYPIVCTVCSILAAITKTRWIDNPIADKVFAIINVLALNVLEAKNADAVKVEKK